MKVCQCGILPNIFMNKKKLEFKRENKKSSHKYNENIL